MANQVVRQDFVLSQLEGLGSPVALAGADFGVRITSSADFQMHTFAVMTSGFQKPGIVSINQIRHAGQEPVAGMRFAVPPLGESLDVSLGCTAATGGETLIVRASCLDDVAWTIKVTLMVITEPGATVSMVKRSTVAPNQGDPLHGRGELNP